MPGKARIDAAGALQHIIDRGIERCRIFYDDNDGSNFLKGLGDIVVCTKTACFAWALIPNHLHQLLRTGIVPIATVMRRLLPGYLKARPDSSRLAPLLIVEFVRRIDYNNK